MSTLRIATTSKMASALEILNATMAHLGVPAKPTTPISEPVKSRAEMAENTARRIELARKKLDDTSRIICNPASEG